MVSLASVSDAVNVWKYESNNLELTSSFRSPSGKCSCLAWNHTNQVVATGGSNPQVHLIQASNGSILSSLQVAQDGAVDTRTNSLALSSNSRFLAAALTSTVQIWDLKRRQIKALLSDHRHPVYATSFLLSGEVVSGDAGGAIRIWDAKAYTSSPVMSAASGTLAVAGVTSLSTPPTGGSSLAAGYSDGTLRVWNVFTHKEVRSQVCHSGSLNSLAYSPRNPRLVTTAGDDGRVTLIDTGAKNSTDPSAVIEIPGVSATSVSFHEDAIHTAIGLSNGRILIYDWRNLRKPVVPKTTASGGNSVAGSAASSRPSRSVAATQPAPAPSTTSNAEGSAPAAPAPPASSTAVPTSTTLTDVPMKVPATPPRHATAAPVVEKVEQPRSPLPMPPSVHRGPPSVPDTQDPPAVPSPDRSSFSRQKASTQPDDSSSAGFQRVEAARASSAVRSPAARSHSVDAENGGASIASAAHSISHYTAMSSIPAPPAASAPPTSASTSTPAGAPRSAHKAGRGQLPPEWVHHAEVVVSSQAHENGAARHDPTLRTQPQSYQQTDGTPRRPVRQAVEEDEQLLDESYSSLRQAVKPVTVRDLEDALALLKYDMHREMQDIIREQIRQFSIAKEETAELLKEMGAQVAELLAANKELRAENERLRRIY